MILYRKQRKAKANKNWKNMGNNTGKYAWRKQTKNKRLNERTQKNIIQIICYIMKMKGNDEEKSAETMTKVEDFINDLDFDVNTEWKCKNIWWIKKLLL